LGVPAEEMNPSGFSTKDADVFRRAGGCGVHTLCPTSRISALGPARSWVDTAWSPSTSCRPPTLAIRRRVDEVEVWELPVRGVELPGRRVVVEQEFRPAPERGRAP
jgi:hypothetical protein